MPSESGMYRVDVYLNNTLLATRDITFRAVVEDDGKKRAHRRQSGLRACLTPEMLGTRGVNTGARFHCWRRRRRKLPGSASAIRPPDQALILRSNVRH